MRKRGTREEGGKWREREGREGELVRSSGGRKGVDDVRGRRVE